MGNLESVPANQNNIIKKKKIIKKKDDKQIKVNNKTNNIINKNHHKKQNKSQNNNLNDYGKKLLQRENIPIPKKNDFNDFSNYNYEIKTKNHDLNDALVNRTMIQNKTSYLDHNNYLERPSNSNNLLINPKPNFDNIKFDPNNFNDQVKEYKTSIEDERNEFEENIRQQKSKFSEYENKKKSILEDKIREFEENYDPWDILGLEYGSYIINDIKKAYKKKALKYHPDKAGKKYENLFNIINQSYIYLLQKAEEENEIEYKTTQDVTNREYESYSDGMVNMHIDKDNFNINKFNEIFEKFRINDENDEGYGDMLKNDKTENQPFFNSKVSNQIFNEHFNKIKDKKSNALIEYDEPNSLNASGTLTVGHLGGDYTEGFGSSNENLGYTDIKQAYYEDNLLINPDKVKIKNYRNVDEYESERSKLNYKPDEQEKMKYIQIENKKKQKEKIRLELLKEKDYNLSNNYNKINKKLIVHKK